MSNSINVVVLWHQKSKNHKLKAQMIKMYLFKYHFSVLCLGVRPGQMWRRSSEQLLGRFSAPGGGPKKFCPSRQA